ncbi:MAG: transglycosylase domain-containing protein [Actinomycetota bacterium]
MQAPPKHRPRAVPPRRPTPAERPEGLRPWRVIAPLVPVLLVLVLAFGAVLVALVLLPIFAGAGAGVNAFRDRLDEAGVGRVGIPRPPERSIIYAADGTELATVYLDENRRVVKLENVAQVARDAVLAIEDAEFYEHGALDFPGLVRAALTNLASGEIEQGASTISQQVVKNVLLDQPQQTFARKFQEAALAIRLERRYSKDEILGLYLNEVYFGIGAYGIGTASETYFAKPPGQLKLAEAALLAGVIRAPGTYDPVVNPDRALARRNVVLDRMADLGWISERKAERAKTKDLGLAEDVGPPEQKVEPFFVYFIRNLILDNETGEFDAFGTTRNQRVHTLYQGGLRIYTTLDPAWQDYAQDAVDASPHLSPEEGEGPDTSLVSVEATTGAIKAMLSGKDYRRDQYDLAWRGIRQTGSAFKPFTLVAAFREDFPAGKVYSSRSPLCGLDGWISASGCVSNAEGGGDAGYMDLWTATENSVNVVFAQLALDVGPENIAETAQLMGITSALDPVPSITLGVEEVSTLDMASAYATLANDGRHCQTFAVARVEQPRENGGWEDLYKHKASCEQVIDEDIAHLVSAMLQRVVTSGTGTAAQIGRPVAGKTGTAQDYTNVYFAGYTPQVATAVWVGFPDGHIPMDTYYGGSVFGGTVAAPIWQDFMARAMQGYPIEGFETAPPPTSGRIPDVVGLPLEEAEATLVEANFTPIVEEIKSFADTNTVLGQSPGGGATAVLGSAVTIQVSNGKGEPVVVPRVTGLSEKDAVEALEDAGLVAAIERTPVQDPALDGVVVEQIPIGNKVVDVGATVTIRVGEHDSGNGNDNDGGGDDGDGDGPDDAGRRRR